MEIWIHRNGQFAGRFSESAIRDKIADGSLSPTDLAWDEAKSAWKPISEFLAAPTAAAPPGPETEKPAAPAKESSSAPEAKVAESPRATPPPLPSTAPAPAPAPVR